MAFPAPDPYTRIFWLVDANGFKMSMDTSWDVGTGVLTINLSDDSVDQTSIVWSEDARQLVFDRILGTGEVQTWTGFLYDPADGSIDTLTGNPPGTTGQISFSFALAGTITTRGGFEDPRRPGFGWFAMGGPGV